MPKTKDEIIHDLEKENKEWQACYEQQVELGVAQYNELASRSVRLARAILAKGLATSQALGLTSQHGVNWRILA